MNRPIPPRVAVAEVLLADEDAVRHVGEAVRDGNADVRAVDFVAPLIFARPPCARPGALAHGIDERFAVRVSPERDAAAAAATTASTPRLRWCTRIGEID